ncbi:MFS transporter [Alteromonas ponticola]|uniref:MFS transporter n=1 Tax=Alteromonas ponticola TaxID=2720613 RepID=A0ABX1R520_9ALTE|nr:MFS transporter [Alteromonas ponticola]NMH60751.1 MFS transporter [Alteromonas ponticola]
MNVPAYVLPIIVVAQFCCTSLWFAGNAVIVNLSQNLNLAETALGHITSAVQFGFISGTLLFAIFAIADRFSPSKVFFVCALSGAIVNLAIIVDGYSLEVLLGLRFLTGFFLAGIYPVGMKIAADHFQKGLGKSLGYLVGALVLGTAFPHLVNNLTASLPWKSVIVATSTLATIGGAMMLIFVDDGPLRKLNSQFDLKGWFNVFNNKSFRASAFGYFGHMWELYAFWAFVPAILVTFNQLHPEFAFNVAVFSFLIIGAGSFACVAGGYLARHFGELKVASTALFLSGGCCLLSPLALLYATPIVFISFLIFWGMVVIADSPLFSTLVARHAPADIQGTALTITNCIGFAITIISIQLITLLFTTWSATHAFLFLVIGPVLGLIALHRKS